MANEGETKFAKLIRSVLISSKGGVPLQRLNNEFKELLGHGIPYKENGFPSLEAYLKSMPRVVAIRRDASGEIMCTGVANEETQHLDRLVKKQKSSKKKSKPSRLPRYASRPSTRPRRPQPHNFRANTHYQYPNAQPQLRWENSHPSHHSYPQQQQLVKRAPPPQQQNQQPPHHASQPSQKGSSQARYQQQTLYEVPPRFRANRASSAADEACFDTPPLPPERSRSVGDNYKTTIDNRNWNDNYGNVDRARSRPHQPRQPLQPSPAEEVVSWVNEVLAEKTGGLWLSGLKKLYQEKFKEPLGDDLVEKLGHLSLWTAEEIRFQSDLILYPNLRRSGTKSISTADLRRSASNKDTCPSHVGNDKILYPNLKVELSTSSGKMTRSVSSRSSSSSSLASLTMPQPLVLPPENMWEVYVSFVINVIDFYCIIVGDDYSEMLCTLEDEMSEFYKSDGSSMLYEEPVEGGLYAAQLSGDWLRVKVTIVDENEAGCFLVDHGDIECVHVDDLRYLESRFSQLPFQAVPCRLYGLDSKAVNDLARERLCNTALGKIRMAEIISRDSRVSLTLYRDTLNINYLCALGDLSSTM